MEYVAVHTYRLWSKWPLKSLGPIGCRTKGCEGEGESTVFSIALISKA
jgi:hypothetical protein